MFSVPRKKALASWSDKNKCSLTLITRIDSEGTVSGLFPCYFIFQVRIAEVLATISEGIDNERMSEYTNVALIAHDKL